MTVAGGDVIAVLETGKTGPAQQVENLTITNVVEFHFDFRQNSLIIIRDNPHERTEWDNTAFDFIQWSPLTRTVVFGSA